MLTPAKPQSPRGRRRPTRSLRRARGIVLRLWHKRPRLSRQRVVAGSGRTLLRARFGTGPIPIRYLRRLGALAGGEDSVRPKHQWLRSSGRLRHPVLARTLDSTMLGQWTMRPETLNFLEHHIRSEKPRLVVELGSGISTLCLAVYMRESNPDAHETQVYSLEQDPSF